jgi:hypothetical protein
MSLASSFVTTRNGVNNDPAPNYISAARMGGDASHSYWMGGGAVRLYSNPGQPVAFWVFRVNAGATSGIAGCRTSIQGRLVDAN